MQMHFEIEMQRCTSLNLMQLHYGSEFRQVALSATSKRSTYRSACNCSDCGLSPSCAPTSQPAPSRSSLPPLPGTATAADMSGHPPLRHDVVIQPRPVHRCPLCPDRSWSQLDPLLKHLERFHLSAGEPLPEPFLLSYGRWVCLDCQLLAPDARACRKCEQRFRASPTEESLCIAPLGGSAC